MGGGRRDFKKDAGLRELLSVQSNEGLGVSLDLRSVIGTEKNFLEPSLLKKLPFKFVFESNEVREFEYWGPFRYQFQGALSLLYGLEVQ